MRIATILDVREYKCTQWKCTNHGVMCVITRYAERWLEVHCSNQDEIGKNNNSTSELKDCSLEINICGAQRQRSASEKTKSKQI